MFYDIVTRLLCVLRICVAMLRDVTVLEPHELRFQGVVARPSSDSPSTSTACVAVLARPEPENHRCWSAG